VEGGRLCSVESGAKKWRVGCSPDGNNRQSRSTSKSTKTVEVVVIKVVVVVVAPLWVGVWTQKTEGYQAVPAARRLVREGGRGLAIEVK
jgi:hypothetical protein